MGGGRVQVGVLAMVKRVPVAILGPGNIGTDLMYKVLRSRHMDLVLMAGVPESQGLERAAELGIPTSTDGVQAVVRRPDIAIVFDATSAKIHRQVNAEPLRQSGKYVVDLTPAAIGPYVVPAVNFELHRDAWNINLVTCGGQATIPIVHAVHRVVPVAYAEIVASIASKSAGPGTRQNIDEFTVTTAAATQQVVGVPEAKAIIVLNPAEPPILMRNTIYCECETDPDPEAVVQSVEAMVAKVQRYVPGYRFKVPPLVQGRLVTVVIEVEGAGDYLPKYAGNLDIMTAAAAAVGDLLAERILVRQEVTV